MSVTITPLMQLYMQRCMQLAQLGFAGVGGNPMVGAVLVHNNTIIGEGFHKQYGAPHAEVNCINNVPSASRHLIAKATLYVNLEPCAHHGKTPPCVDLIIASGIKSVVIGCIDSFAAVSGRGVQALQQAGIDTIVGVLEQECLALNHKFFTAQQLQVPYVALKWAQSADGFVNDASAARTIISNAYSQRWVHRYRASFDAIMVGTNTIQVDNPKLDARLYNNKPLIVIVVDRSLRLDINNYAIAQASQLIILNDQKGGVEGNINYLKIEDNSNFFTTALRALFNLGIRSLLIEGGATLQQAFLASQPAQEICVITNTQLKIGQGILAPKHQMHSVFLQQHLQNDIIRIWR